MLIGFVGDVHGLVYHALALVTTWQRKTGRKLDLVVQVGDMGAYPTLDSIDEAGRRHVEIDPAQADFSRLLQADGVRAEHLRAVRGEMSSAIHFLRGNHEDFQYLSGLPLDEADGTAKVDGFGLFRYVPDGTVLQLRDLKIAFLGGIEAKGADPRSIDTEAYQLLMDLGPGSLDILATHEPPYGVGIGYRGQVSGSKLITGLIEHTQPAFHFSGHVHHLNGPRSYGRTWSWEPRLSDLVRPVAPGRERVQDGMSGGPGHQHLVPAASHGLVAAGVRYQGLRLRLVVRGVYHTWVMTPPSPPLWVPACAGTTMRGHFRAVTDVRVQAINSLDG